MHESEIHAGPSRLETAPETLEIERKFLVTTTPDNLDAFPLIPIKQGYLHVGTDLEVRVRQAGEDYTQTVKTTGGLVRTEVELPLTKPQFDSLWEMTDGARIEKHRVEMPYAEHVIALDIYQGSHGGHMVAEVEFDSIASSEAFDKPLWLGDEVTENKAYRNSTLALHGFPSLEAVPDDPHIPEINLTEGVDTLIALIAERKELTDDPLLVHVAGRTSAGKTTAVTSEILKAFPEHAVLSMDDYSKGNRFIADMAQEGVAINWDHPEYMDFALLRSHLSALKNGETIEKPVFSFKTGERDGFAIFEPKEVIVVEGLFALRPEIVDVGDVKTFVDISLHGSIVRRLLRDVERTNMHPLDILRYYLQTVEPMYQEHIAGTKENADLVLVNEYNPKVESHRTNMHEVQTKFKGTVSDEVLRKAGAEMLGVISQHDIYFSPTDRQLADSDESIRIRREGERRVLSYKGPRVDGEVRVRPKFEFEIDQETEERFLEGYGNAVNEIAKTRKLYVLDGTVLTLDTVTKLDDKEVVYLGDFIEVRCDREAADAQLARICERLGLDPADRSNLSYVDM